MSKRFHFLLTFCFPSGGFAILAAIRADPRGSAPGSDSLAASFLLAQPACGNLQAPTSQPAPTWWFGCVSGYFWDPLGRVGNVWRCFLAAKACASSLGGVSRQSSQVLAAKGVLLVSRQVRSLPGCQRRELWQVLPYCNCLLHMHLWPIMAGWGRVLMRP